ncbi:alpha/beta fold hydrolase [Thermomonospora umbrina]|uniref:Alpha-beta hydrolase superfamily lysophospholipase n=1 Tax=Thermomonospora umbrina TaxID=111806 RepID=A0A3D9T4N8_9ACTN|nr:alpha/beta fold hydrolase [Thermomonospora umbrina]REE98771.1 alpha-beta hydrolase superfamily lysophospholipase [Thermomonospora umbrina]
MPITPIVSMRDGRRGRLAVYTWAPPRPSFVAVLSHGYAEHLGRYGHVAEHLAALGALVVGPDHEGHGRSSGDRSVIRDFTPVVDDLHDVLVAARAAHPGLPVAVIGHSMGGLIAGRLLQTYPSCADALALSGPLAGREDFFTAMVAGRIPNEAPFDIALLTRDEALAQAYDDDPLVHRGAFPLETAKAVAVASHDLRTGPRFGLPVLLLYGTDDRIVPMNDSAPVIRRLGGRPYEEFLYEDARHEVFNETDRTQVLTDLGDFLARHLATT